MMARLRHQQLLLQVQMAKQLILLIMIFHMLMAEKMQEHMM